MLSSKYWITNCIILTILAFSTFATSLAYAAPQANNGKDWQYPNGNSWAWNYSPQDQINKNNVKNLEVKWLFPIGSKALAPKGIQNALISESTASPPVVRNGVVYLVTDYMRTIAIDAETGKQLWAHSYDVNMTEMVKKLPLFIQGSFHKHGFQYWENGDAIINLGLACDFYAVDAKTGKEKFWVKDLCKDIPGNIAEASYLSRRSAQGSIIGVYDKGKQFIYIQPGYIHSTLIRADARHVTMGIDMDTKKVIWRVFSAPPQDIPTKDWALQECDRGFWPAPGEQPGYITCEQAAAKNRAGLEWDWAFPNEAPSKWGGVTANWGQYVVDEDTGFMYTSNGNQGPYSNLTMTPGPRLYGSAIMAIDLNKGQRAWWLQPEPHDPYDYDCNWNGVLVDHPQVGKIFVKGCKEGRLYAMDARTGKPVWVKDVVNEEAGWGQISSIATKENGQGGIKYHLTDASSYYDMREWNWISYPAKSPGQPGKYCTLPCTIFPYFGNGIFGTDISYDPETQSVIHYAVALQVDILRENPYVVGGELFITKGYPTTNTTIVSRDAATGKVNWTWFYQIAQQRAHLVTTGGMVFSGFTDGTLKFIDKSSGKLIHEMNAGAAITVGPVVGKDSAGNSKIFTLVGSRNSNTPGTLVAIGLSDRVAADVKTTTVTTTSLTTSITTATTTTATTITTTQAPQTTTVTSSQTVTTTQQITQTTGLPAEVTYAAVAVAVIAIIGAAVLVMRKK